MDTVYIWYCGGKRGTVPYSMGTFEDRVGGGKYFKIKQFKNQITLTPFLITIEMCKHKSKNETGLKTKKLLKALHCCGNLFTEEKNELLSFFLF